MATNALQATEGLLTIKQAAKRLGTSEIHVYRLTWEKVLPSVKLAPRVRRIDPRDLEAYIESRKVKAQ